MNVDEVYAETVFFEKMPELFPLYRRLKNELEKAYPNLEIKVSKTQISFRNRTVFAMVSLPWRKVKGWPEKYLLVSFGLACRKESPRIAQSVEAYPNRWTHHVIVTREEEIDRELFSFIDEAYQFSMLK